MLFDLPLPELETYRPQVREPADFDGFWAEQLSRADEVAVDPRFVVVQGHWNHAVVYDVTYAGYGAAPIKGWLLVPHRLAPRPAMVVEFIGYGGGRGTPYDYFTYSCAGHPHFVMDTRGQGGGWRASDTPDPHDSGEPGGAGFLVRGVSNPRGHYYTRVYVDAARAVEAARRHPAAAGLPIVTTGASQGGGLSLAAAHLDGDVAATMPDVPFLADFEHAVRTTPMAPYKEIIDYGAVYPHRVESVFDTLSYLDVVNHAKRIGIPGLYSVGLVDELTPASTVYAAYNHHSGPKEMTVYPFNGHEGGGSRHLQVKLGFLEGLGSANPVFTEENVAAVRSQDVPD